MDKKTLTELDYYRIRDMVASHCLAEESSFIMSRMEPLADAEEIEKNKKLSIEWFRFISTTRSPALKGWNPVYPVFKIISTEGSTLTLEQTKDLGLFCNCVYNVRSSIENNSRELSLDSLDSLVKTLPDLGPVSSAIFRIITSDGELRDLPQISAIHSKIASLNAKIKGIMQGFTGSSRYADVLESTVPVLRGGRQVLAVKSNRRSAVPGIIHEMSQSGQTVYIEPDEAVKCSNDLVEAEFELSAEIRKILTELADKIRPYNDDLKTALKIMEKLDITHAAARWGKDVNGVYAAQCRENEPLQLLKARHPLLGEKAVPIDVRFMPGKRILIITGPNTGGKTVTLKTIALFAMLNQTGFPVPAAEGTRLPVFKGVYADIGDEQSMDESLSTFSGHMKNIAKAVRYVNEDSLVLLDELGSGTDPQEGAAISMAVLDRLIEKRAWVLITTHQGVIKNYGYTHPECINASVEFNSNTLSPTYNLLMGIPGESHALDIAKRSGLPKDIVEKAREYIVSEKTDVSALIKGLTKKHAEIDEMASSFNLRQAELEEHILRNEEKTLELRKKELELKEGFQKESQEFLAESRRKLENLVRMIKEGEITREKTLGVKSFIKELSEDVEDAAERLENEEAELARQMEALAEKVKNRVSHKSTKKRRKLADALESATSIASDRQNEKSADGKKHVQLEVLEFAVGASVTAGKNKQEGVIVAAKGKAQWDVQFGSVRMTVKQKDLTLVSSPKKRTPTYTLDLAGDSKDSKPAYELRLLGMHSDEAVRVLERQIDLCILSNLKNFSVIHGNGNGVLRQSVQDYLSNSPSVLDFHFARPEEGGFGKTYVTLR